MRNKRNKRTPAAVSEVFETTSRWRHTARRARARYLPPGETFTKATEKLKVRQKENKDGTTSLLYQRTKEHDGAVEIATSNRRAPVRGEVRRREHSQVGATWLGSESEVVDNVVLGNGVADVEVNFSDTFSKDRLA